MARRKSTPTTTVTPAEVIVSKKTTRVTRKQVQEFNDNDEIIEEAVEEIEEEEELDFEELENEIEDEEANQEAELYEDDDEGEDEDDEVPQEEDSIIYDTETNLIKPEAIFYKPPTPSKKRGNGTAATNGTSTLSGGKSSSEIAEKMGENSWNDYYKQPKHQHISNNHFAIQSDYYTKQQLDQLSSEIRRHPSIAAKSFHFLSFGLSTKINHQWIRILLSSVIMFSLIATIFYCPLPHIKHIVLSPDGPSIQTTNSHNEFNDDLNFGNTRKLTAFKDNWTRFSIFGVSNFLCSNYNFNPIYPNSATLDENGQTIDAYAEIPKEFSSVHELKNLKIFGSCILFGVLLFLVWLLAARLSEKEIIIKSNIPLQMLHSLITLVIIPLITMIFWSLFLVYFIQTVLVGSKNNTATGNNTAQEDVLHCVNHLSNSLSEVSSFSPVRELFLGSVAIVLRLVNYFHPLSIESLALHQSTLIGKNLNEMKLVSFIWTLIVGSAIYHTLMIASYLYSIFHEYPTTTTATATTVVQQQADPNASSSSSTTTATTTTKTVQTKTISVDPSSLSLMSLDLKFLPSFIPEVLLTQNFIIVFIWSVAACCLWVFGIPPNLHIHEGELFYIFLSLAPLLKSIYNLVIIEQKKEKIMAIHNSNTWKSEIELEQLNLQRQQQDEYDQQQFTELVGNSSN